MSYEKEEYQLKEAVKEMSTLNKRLQVVLMEIHHKGVLKNATGSLSEKEESKLLSLQLEEKEIREKIQSIQAKFREN